MSKSGKSFNGRAEGTSHVASILSDIPAGKAAILVVDRACGRSNPKPGASTRQVSSLNRELKLAGSKQKVGAHSIHREFDDCAGVKISGKPSIGGKYMEARFSTDEYIAFIAKESTLMKQKGLIEDGNGGSLRVTGKVKRVK